MIEEIAELLKIAAEKPAAYQRHIEQILGWGAVETSRSEPHIAVTAEVKPAPQKDATGGDEYANAQTIIEKHCEEEWPDNYRMRAFCIEQEEHALKELKDGRPADIPEDVFHKIRRQSAEQWPSQFSMRLFTEQEFKSFRKLRQRRK